MMKCIFTHIFFALFTLSLTAQEYDGSVIPGHAGDTVFAVASNPDDTGLNPGSSSDIELRVYPNPVHDQSFTTSSNKNLRSITIYSILGKQVYTEKFAPETNQVKIYLNNVAQGLYIMKVKHDSGDEVVHRIRVIQ